MPKPGRRRPDGPVKARNGLAGAKWEGGTSGKTVPEAGGFPANPPATTRKALATLVQSIPSVHPLRRYLAYRPLLGLVGWFPGTGRCSFHSLPFLAHWSALSVVAACLAAALRLASLRLRDCRWASAQILHRDSPGIAGLLQFWHLPSSLALCLCSSAWCRRYSMRSGVLFLACSYSRRVSPAVSGSLALVAGGLFPSPLGFGLGGFFLARLVCLVPARGLPGIGKVCWSKILLGDCAGVGGRLCCGTFTR